MKVSVRDRLMLRKWIGLDFGLSKDWDKVRVRVKVRARVRLSVRVSVWGRLIQCSGHI